MYSRCPFTAVRFVTGPSLPNLPRVQEIFLREATALRARFDASARAPAAAAARLLREGEAEALAATHPDPYTVCYMPGGSKFMRNPPLPLEAVFASTPGGVPPEYHIAEQTVVGVQVPHSQQPPGTLIDCYKKSWN